MVSSAPFELPDSLWKDEHGAIQIANTRITLDVIIAAYQHGDTPKEINRGYPTLTLADIYAILAYYLKHREWVDAYLRERDEQSELIYRELEVRNPESVDLRARLIKRMMH